MRTVPNPVADENRYLLLLKLSSMDSNSVLFIWAHLGNTKKKINRHSMVIMDVYYNPKRLLYFRDSLYV